MGRLYAPVGRLARGFDRGERANEPELLALVCSQCDRTHGGGRALSAAFFSPIQAEHGVHGHQVLRSIENPNDVIVTHTFNDGKALDKLFNQQLALAGERSIPITIVVLIPSQLIPMDPNVTAVVLLIGLAVGVDYSLFYIKREREERAAGKDPGAALAADGILPQLGWRWSSGPTHDACLDVCRAA